MGYWKQTFSEFSADRCTTLAAALAYFTAFALPPLLYLLLTILTFGMSLAYDSEQAKAEAQQVLTTQTAQLIGNQSINEEISAILKNNDETSGKWWKSLLSFAGIVLGATGVVAALQDAMNQVWAVRPNPDKSGIKVMLRKRLLSFGMILGLGILLLASLIVSTVVTAAGERLTEWIGIRLGLVSGLSYLVQALVVMIVFAAIFKWMPDAKTEWREVIVGAFISTVLFLVGRYALDWYFSFATPGAQLSSAAASIAVLLVWVYYTSMIVLFGAECVQVYAMRYGKGVRPEHHAVHVVETIERS
ncbi:ribonuclease BN [Rhodopirellula maiorica SM1]|uniref:Ribonuclease BN n=1 Tax=Rhodopirellula maiorica SM1 TaxID=1265738 RepID=M5RB31_9BACT|nr:YihY/virulence factor BrkB family protein [Rhodopirellula maiorica]EMI16261.1 ribonuclease BN [Rhodopirellula maiorica SM1]